jgi:putative NIF3 family GTP cyclohydrolase 1 type 2
MSPRVALSDVVAYLDGYLRIREVPDYDGALNGLQVENSGAIDRVVAAVDASQATIDGVAALGGSPLLLVHHGLFFDGNLPVTGRR